jgi:hypothetical protein
MLEDVGAQHRHNEDAEAETRGALDETRADAQQEYGKDYATHCYKTKCFIG